MPFRELHATLRAYIFRDPAQGGGVSVCVRTRGALVGAAILDVGMKDEQNSKLISTRTPGQR